VVLPEQSAKRTIAARGTSPNAHAAAYPECVPIQAGFAALIFYIPGFDSGTSPASVFTAGDLPEPLRPSSATICRAHIQRGARLKKYALCHVEGIDGVRKAKWGPESSWLAFVDAMVQRLWYGRDGIDSATRPVARTGQGAGHQHFALMVITVTACES